MITSVVVRAGIGSILTVIECVQYEFDGSDNIGYNILCDSFYFTHNLWDWGSSGLSRLNARLGGNLLRGTLNGTCKVREGNADTGG